MIKQLLAQSQPYRFILGARDLKRAEKDFIDLSYDKQKHSFTFLPLQLSDLRTVRSFAAQALEKLGQSKIDLLLLNAGINKPADEPGVNGSKWCESYIVNSLSQHYLTHLLRERVTGRVVVVSSGVIRGVSDAGRCIPSKLLEPASMLHENQGLLTATLARVDLLEKELSANSGTDFQRIYEDSKFVQLLTAHWWRRELQGQAQVIAVSPGMVPGTTLTRGAMERMGIVDMPESAMKNARTVPQGRQAAFTP